MNPPLAIKRVHDLMKGFPHSWFLAGDWAVDAWLGRTDRPGGAVVIGVFDDDHLAIADVFRDWRLVAHDPQAPLGEPGWSGRRLEQDALSMTRPKVYAASPEGLEVEIVVHRRAGDQWLLLELPPEPPVTVPVESAIGLTAWGIPAALPQVLMFVEAFSWRARNFSDLGAVLPTLSEPQRQWLRDAIAGVAPDYPWVAVIDQHVQLCQPENAAQLAAAMRAEEFRIEERVVRDLVATQFPEWAHLPLEKVQSVGTVNDIFRLGADKAIRLPRRPRFHDDIELGPRLDALAPHLPVEVPRVLALGGPDLGYPWPWSVTSWIEGETWRTDRLADPSEAAIELANFIHALHRVPPALVGLSEPLTIRPTAEQAGSRLAARYDLMRALARATDWVGTDDFLNAWVGAARAASWEGEMVLLHADLKADNVLVANGQLHAIIDWTGMHVGDPALDAAAAWRVLSDDERPAFRAALDVDDQTWDRARGLVLGDIFTYHYYADLHPQIAATAKRFVLNALSDWRP